MGVGVHGVGLDYDSRGRVFLLRSRSKKVCSVAHLAFIDVDFRRIVPGTAGR